MSQRVLIRFKYNNRALVAAEDGRVFLAEQATAALQGRLWIIDNDGTIANTLPDGLRLTVLRGSEPFVIGSSDDRRSTKWNVSNEGMIQLTSDPTMCLCVPNGRVIPEVRLRDQDVKTNCHFYWEFVSEEGELLSPARLTGVTEVVDYPKTAFGYPGPGYQTPSMQDVVENAFFVQEAEWNAVRECGEYDFVVIGSGFCSLAFVSRALKNNPFARILILERGSFLLPDHFQNLPMPFQKTLKGVTETYPWSVTPKTHHGKYVKFQHGVVPFVGGRSTTWSGWCPKPSSKEMEDWPKKAVSTVHEYFGEAEKLLNVVQHCDIYEDGASKPLFGVLQRGLENALRKNQQKIETVTRIMPASLAIGAPDSRHVAFNKFAVPGPLLQLLQDQKEKAALGKGWIAKLAVNCIVTRIVHDGGKATAIDSSRGMVTLGDAKVVLAMGSLPPATLMLNSFPKESFPGLANIGERFTGHTVSIVIARVPRVSLPYGSRLEDVELGAMYVAGVEPNSGAQYHIQLTAASSTDPVKGESAAFHHMPDVRASPSKEQFATSTDHVLFVCAVLGELDHLNRENWFRLNDSDSACENSDLQVITNQQDEIVWDTMEMATFQLIECALEGTNVQYWHEATSGGTWRSERPPVTQIRGPGIVHEASTMWMGDEEDKSAPVGVDYRPRGVENVYITGAALYPRCGSWNPTGPMVALSIHLADSISPPVGKL